MTHACAQHSYAIALGSNRRHGRHGLPERIIAAALNVLAGHAVEILAISTVAGSDAIGPSARRYANGAALIETALEPPALLALLKRIERDFGRRNGVRWGARVLDIDIILWSGGVWSTATLTIPHLLWRERRFVVEPLASIVPDWRDPLSGLTVRQLSRRLLRARPVDPAPRTA